MFYQLVWVLLELLFSDLIFFWVESVADEVWFWAVRLDTNFIDDEIRSMGYWCMWVLCDWFRWYLGSVKILPILYLYSLVSPCNSIDKYIDYIHSNENINLQNVYQHFTSICKTNSICSTPIKNCIHYDECSLIPL